MVYSSLQIASEFSMIGVPDLIDKLGVRQDLQCQHHQVPSTLIPGTEMHTVVLFVAELQHVVVLCVELEPFRQIAYLVVQREYHLKFSSTFCVSVHAKTLL